MYWKNIVSSIIRQIGLKERESKIEDLLSFVCEIADKNTEKDCRKNFNLAAADYHFLNQIIKQAMYLQSGTLLLQSPPTFHQTNISILWPKSHTLWTYSTEMIPIIYGRKDLYLTPWKSFQRTSGNVPKEFVHEVRFFPTSSLLFVELWTEMIWKSTSQEQSLPKTSGMIPKELKWCFQRRIKSASRQTSPKQILQKMWSTDDYIVWFFSWLRQKFIIKVKLNITKVHVHLVTL